MMLTAPCKRFRPHKPHEQNAQINAFQKRLPNHFRYFPHSFSNARQTG